ncbi:MAG TPA: hypothetical protein ENN51_02805, partial [candidate division WOR-3 bacterium]|nr:hypothetical protein [candidate division WOR-3 bacterium]
MSDETLQSADDQQSSEAAPEAQSNEAPASPDEPRTDGEEKESFASLYEKSFPKLRPGEIVTGRIIKKLPNSV